jgi:DNA-binding MarR family transcriptional regulator
VNDEREALIQRIIETQRELGRAFARLPSPLFSSNLTMRQLQVVLLLSTQGSASGQELAHDLGVSLGTVTGIVDRLVAQGMASRHEDPNDRRVRRVALTDAGAQLVDQINEAGIEHFRRIVEHLDNDTLRAVDDVSRRIKAAAQTLFKE